MFFRDYLMQFVGGNMSDIEIERVVDKNKGGFKGVRRAGKYTAIKFFGTAENAADIRKALIESGFCPLHEYRNKFRFG